MAGLRDHTELDVWKLSAELEQRVYELTERPAFERHFKLRCQLKDAADSPCPNIAEGFSRYHPREIARFVRVAKSSLTEVIDHLRKALARSLITKGEHDDLVTLARRARGAATGYIIYLESATAPHLPRTEPKQQKRPNRSAGEVRRPSPQIGPARTSEP